MNKKLLIFLSMICIFFYVEDVKAETGYYDDDGNYYTLLFENTPLRTFVTRDFALNYKYRDYTDSTDIAIIESTSNSGTYTYRKGFDKNKELLKVIYQIPDNLKNTYGYQYVMYVYPDYATGNRGAIVPQILENKKLRRLDSGQHVVYQKQTYLRNHTLVDDVYNMLNYDINNYEGNISINEITSTGIAPTGNAELIIAVKTDGQIEVFSDLVNRTSQKWLYTAMRKSDGTAPSNYLIYSSVDVYDSNGENVIIPKEEFEERTITSNYSLTCDEDNPFIYNLHFDISDLKTNDKVVITYNEDSILLNETLTEEKNSFTIENGKTGNYNIKVYDDSGELIHENSFYIKVDSDVQIDVSDEDININSDDDVSTILNKNNIFLNKALVIVTPLIQIVVTFYNNLPTFLKLALISIFISLLIYLLVRRLT